MIKFEAKKHKGASKIIDWSKVEFVDGAEDKRPIKRITLDIDAGGVAEVIVERYVMAKDEDGYSLSTLNDKKESILLTYKERYCVDAEATGNLLIKLVKCEKDQL